MGVVVLSVANAHTQSPSEPAADHQEQASHHGALVVLGHLTRALAFAAVTYSFAVTAWQARRDGGDAAFVVGAYAALAALLLFLRRAEQLTPASPAWERRRLQAAVWALSTALSCAFAYRVSLLMPAALVVLVWCMTSFVALMGFYMLVLCKYQQHQKALS
ncbi:hypothetical protein PR202_ga11471 [Eleusine coracana subsp. coracana]|uniref:Uncharacterized protein n=1 Tax=Eleusine coracana subsp. coracana TaxID=191504 RepID=A0AAV5C928_ELECO|nr:hypothetical protein PR202_ga11471 [Eleusine coracana subsp. coracana]